MDDLLKEFLSETIENLGLLDSELVRLEQNPQDPTLLQNIFRIVHTIKGTCGFLGLPRLQKLAHAGENVLGRFRDGTLLATPDAVGLVLAAVDGIKNIVNVLAATQAEPAGDDAALIAELDRLAESEGGTIEAAPPAVDALAEASNAPDPSDRLDHPDHAVAEKPVEPAKAANSVAAPAQTQAADIGAQAIRVNVDLLEDLMTIASELVLTRNQLMQILRTQKDSVFGAALQRLSQVTTELQEGVMKTRMQPIGNAWAKLPRLVRDLARDLGKKLDLRMIGAETELDRQVLEMVRDPLTHMVRNCADHGIETPAERLAAGKPETGTITLNAHHVGGHIVVEIGDDGRGVATDRIRKKAIANGLATEAELATMNEQQIQQFVFRPGFSTAEAITNISGRGVGLDVVRTNIEKIGGTVELRTAPGKGTKFVIKIPLTLAIVSALIVECLNDRFAIPQINVVELVHTAANSDHRVERLKGVPVLRLRDKILAARLLAQDARPCFRQQQRIGRNLRDRHAGWRAELRHHGRSRVRHRGNRGETGVPDAARFERLFGQHHPRRWQRCHDPRSQRHYGFANFTVEESDDKNRRAGRGTGEQTRRKRHPLPRRRHGAEGAAARARRAA